MKSKHDELKSSATKLFTTDKAGAVALLKQCLAEESAHPLLGPAHEITLETLSDLAEKAGYIPQCLDDVRGYCSQLVAALSALRGAEHRDTLEAAALLPSALERCERWAEAIEAWTALAEMCKRAGADSQEALLDAQGKAALIRGLHVAKTKAEWNKAAEELRAVVREREACLGKAHKSTVKADIEVGDILIAHKDVKGAKQQWEEAMLRLKTASASVQHTYKAKLQDKIDKAK